MLGSEALFSAVVVVHLLRTPMANLGPVVVEVVCLVEGNVVRKLLVWKGLVSVVLALQFPVIHRVVLLRVVVAVAVVELAVDLSVVVVPCVVLGNCGGLREIVLWMVVLLFCGV